MWFNIKVVLVFLACVFYVFALPADADGIRKDARAKPHEDELSHEEHFKDGEHNAEFDREAFLGDRKEEFDHLSPEEAQRRLKILLKQVDADGDSYVSSDELRAWVKDVFKNKMVQGMESDINEKDKNGDGLIDWDEFLKDSYGDDVSADDEEMKKMIDRDRKHYDVADTDKDGKLTATEFGSFLHPESNPEMQALNAQETLEDMDRDKDGKLDLNEFLGEWKDPDNDSQEEPDWVKEESDRFKNELDKNGDGILDSAELTAWITPDTDATIVEEEVKHLISESDDDKDGKLSVEEVIAHHDIFTGSEATDYGQALPRDDL